MNKPNLVFSFSIALLMSLALALAAPVWAQGSAARLFFNPSPLQIDTSLDPTGVVTLEVADGVDIFAFDLFVQYDASLLSVSQVELGDFLGEGLVCGDEINQPGLVHYSCTRFDVGSGVSGSGDLLVLHFEALEPGGDSALELSGSELYNWPDVEAVELTLEDGAVSVRSYWTYLPLILSASGHAVELLH